MTGLLGRLFAVAEAYPELKANTNFLQLQDQLCEHRDRAAGRSALLQRDRSRPEFHHPELPAVVDRAADGLYRGALLPGRGPGDPKRAESVVRPSGGLTCASSGGTLAALLALHSCCRSRGRADSALSQRRPGPEGQLDRGHRDDRRPGRERPHQPRHLSRLPDPLSRAERHAIPRPLHLRRRDSRRSPVKASVGPSGTGMRIKLGDPDSLRVRRRA